jgi:hypothetical protein
LNFYRPENLKCHIISHFITQESSHFHKIIQDK